MTRQHPQPPLVPPPEPGLVRCRRGLRRRGGFTLVELMVALSLTAILLAAVYNMFITSSSVFQTQEEVATAQYQVESGLQLILNDLRLAGMGSTANTNPVVNSQVTSDITLHGIATPENNDANVILFNENIVPDVLRISGNFSSPRAYPAMLNAGLRVASLTTTQDGSDPNSPRLTETDFNQYFGRVGRLIAVRSTTTGRILLTEVKSTQGYGVIELLTTNGFTGLNEMVWVNPVDIYQYRIVRKNPANNLDSDTHLIRESLDKNLKPLDQAPLIVADRAVDFQVWFNFYNPRSKKIDLDGRLNDTTSNISEFDVKGGGESCPELIRTAIVRLAVRTGMEHTDVAFRARADELERLVTFDVDGNQNNGAAPVVTMTGEVQVPNFSNEDLSATTLCAAGGGGLQ